MAQRHSPLHEALLPLSPTWSVIHGMPAPLHMAGDERALGIRLSDASCLPRMGVKGAGAQAWLQAQGLDALPGVNSWLRTPDGLLVARLARSEFFLEDSARGTSVARLQAALAPAAGVTPVLRQDAAMVLGGPRVNELLTQVCNVDFQAWQADDHIVVMTTMAGVSVLVLWEGFQQGTRYRLWCDPTFAPYLWQEFGVIARELDGAVTGLQSLMPEILA